MNRIVIAFARNASREKIHMLAEQCGYNLRYCFRSGAEVIRAIRKMGGGVVVCGSKLTDMTADQLAESLEGMAQILVAASPVHLEMIERSDIHRIASPISRVEFSQTLDALLRLDDASQRANIPQRSEAEKAKIDRAKDILMANGMTEAQAHSFLQQRSMRNRCTMVQTAERIIASNGEPALI